MILTSVAALGHHQEIHSLLGSRWSTFHRSGTYQQEGHIWVNCSFMQSQPNHVKTGGHQRTLQERHRVCAGGHQAKSHARVILIFLRREFCLKFTAIKVTTVRIGKGKKYTYNRERKQGGGGGAWQTEAWQNTKQKANAKHRLAKDSFEMGLQAAKSQQIKGKI